MISTKAKARRPYRRVFRQGRIVQCASPDEPLFGQNRLTSFVGSFVGQTER